LTRYLGEHFSTLMPRIIAAEPDRRWFLMAACRGQRLEEIGDVTVWGRAASRYARLQIDCIERVGALRSLGCPLRDLEALARSIAALAADTDALRPGQSEGLTESEFGAFSAMVPVLRQRCDELARCGIPYSLEHGDLWPGNIYCDATSCAVIDWEDAVVAHPFFSLAPLTVGLMSAGLGTSENVARLERAYTAAFESIASPDRLRRAVELALPLCFLDMAARYHRQRPSIVRLHPWMRDLVPQTLRLALSRM
jgi:aminoglycoside phosphotransferase (APT) family kinase protein